MSIYLYLKKLNKILDNRIEVAFPQKIAWTFDETLMTLEDYTETKLKNLSSRDNIYINHYFWNYNYCRMEQLSDEYKQKVLEKYENVLIKSNLIPVGKLIHDIIFHEILINMYTLSEKKFTKLLADINIDRDAIANTMIKSNYNLMINSNFKLLVERIFYDDRLLDLIFNGECHFTCEQINELLVDYNYYDLNDIGYRIMTSVSYSLELKLQYIRILIDNYKEKIDQTKEIYIDCENFKIYLAYYLYNLDIEGELSNLYYDVIRIFLNKGGAEKVIILNNKNLKIKMDSKYKIIQEYFKLD